MRWAAVVVVCGLLGDARSEPAARDAGDVIHVEGTHLELTVPRAAWGEPKIQHRDDGRESIAMWIRRPIRHDTDGSGVLMVFTVPWHGDDVVLFSAQRRSQMSFDVEKTFSWEDGLLAHKGAIGYFSHEKGMRTIHVHVLDGKTGVEVMLATPTEDDRQVEPELRRIMKSLRIARGQDTRDGKEIHTHEYVVPDR